MPDEREADLESARDLARAGVPLFMAPPDPEGRTPSGRNTGYALPAGWERGARADPALVDALPPDWALCAAMGHGVDLVDLDPRNADPNGIGMPALPPALAEAETPSGGRHLFVLSLGLPSLDGVAPGLDYKGGDPTGVGRGFAFVAPTVRPSKVDGSARPYRWTRRPVTGRLRDAIDWAAAHDLGAAFDPLRAAVLRRREHRAEGEPREVLASVAAREWHLALTRLESDLRGWARTGWGGEAHAGLLAHTTHLARLWPEGAEAGYLYAFERAGLRPDEADLAKLESALASAVPDVVVPDEGLSRQELFWAGGRVMPDPPRGDPLISGGSEPSVAAPSAAFEFCDPAWLECPPEPPEPAYGAFGGPRALFYAEGVHWLQGESESGKTWVGLHLALEALRAGGAVLVVDYEDTRDGVLARLRDLGITAGELARLVYVAGHDAAHADLVGHLAATDRDYALLLVDGVTSALSSAGLSGRDEQELTRWADAVPRRARMAVCVDHVVKSPDERNGMAIGTQAKKSVVTGTSFEVRCTVKFGRGTVGQVELRLQKDKRGGVRGRAREVTRLRFASDPGTGAVTLSAAHAAPSTAEEFLGAGLAAEAQVKIKERVRVLEEDPRSNPSQSVRTLVARLRDLGYGGDDRTVVRPAVRQFMAGGGVPVNPDPEEGDT